MVTTGAEQKRKRRRYWLTGGIIFLVIAAVAVLIWFGFSQGWTGFGGSTTVSIETTDPQGNKTTTQIYSRTLWDWLGLLIIPAALGVGVFFLNRWEQRRQAKIAQEQADRERNLADKRAELDRQLTDRRAETDRALALDRLRADRLQAYLDRMTELLLEGGLRRSAPDSEIRGVARTRTLTVLRDLDGARKGSVVSFLRDADLINREPPDTNPIIPLDWAELDGTLLENLDLSERSLSAAYLTNANLHGAVLRRTDLSETDLSGADLSGADLTEADLRRALYDDATVWPVGFPYQTSGAAGPRAELMGVDLNGAYLSEADLCGAILTGAKLQGANLADAKYDDATKWPNGFDPVAAGAKKADPKSPKETNAGKGGQQ